MKGVVFTEFLELVEQTWGLEMVDRLLVNGCPFHGGYTSVGTYNHEDMLSMVQELSRATGTPVKPLVEAFGKYLFQRFLASYPAAFEGVVSTFELLERVEKTIHVEVLKLTPDAELPRFEFVPAAAGELVVIYRSSRPFADLAEGLIRGCIEYYQEQLDIHREDLSSDGTQARFRLTPSQISSEHPAVDDDLTSMPVPIAAPVPAAMISCPFSRTGTPAQN